MNLKYYCTFICKSYVHSLGFELTIFVTVYPVSNYSNFYPKFYVVSCKDQRDDAFIIQRYTTQRHKRFWDLVFGNPWI